MTGVSLFDWEIYRHLFGGAEMERLFEERATLARLVEVERAVSRAQGAVGIIPADAVGTMDAALDVEALDLERLRADTRDVGRPIAGLVAQLMEQAGDAGLWVHYGVTTYDTMDTGRVLQIRDGLAALQADLDGVLHRLSALAREHRDTLMIARTNNLHAQSQTFGLKLAAWIEELRCHRDRLSAAAPRVLMVQFGGAVG
ncbi:MAG: lyase family protein, partial [Alphaproteobacteria bacterium]